MGIANMTAATNKHVPFQEAFRVIPFVGTFFIDMVNALIVKFFVGLTITAYKPIP